MPISSERTPEIPTQHLAEYAEIGTRYGEGFKYFLDVCKMLLLLQAGLGTAVGLILQNETLKKGVSLQCAPAVNLPLLLLAMIGVLSGVGALIVGSRFHKYHNAVSDRALELELLYGMKLMTNVRAVFEAGNYGKSATGIGFALFLLICGLWIVLAFDSLRELMRCFR